jgi:hypothetical protein
MTRLVVGIDISKAKLDVCLLRADGSEAYQQVANTPDGKEMLDLP